MQLIFKVHRALVKYEQLNIKKKTTIFTIQIRTA